MKMKNQKKNLFLTGILALALVFVFGLTGCGGGGGGASGGDTFTGTDLAGNSYTLLTGSAAAKAVKTNDAYKLTVKEKGGATNTSTGKVTKVNADGTLELKPNNGDTFSVVINGNSVDSVEGEITYTDGKKFAPRTFNKIFLRAHRWEGDADPENNTKVGHGESWHSGDTAFMSDFSKVTSLATPTHDRYKITIEGTSNVDLNHVIVSVIGTKANGEVTWFGNTNYDGAYLVFPAGVKKTYEVFLETGHITGTWDFSKYDEVALNVEDVLNTCFGISKDPAHAGAHGWDINDSDHWGEHYGDLPKNIPEGQVMAIISDFRISFKDTKQ